MRSIVAFILLFLHYCSLFVNSFDFNSIMGQAISSSNFFFYGKKHFTKTGYLKHIKSYYSDPVQNSAAIVRGKEGADGVDLSGKVVVVTGANSGLGKEVATYAAAKGAKLYMLCRNQERAETAKQDIVKQTNGDVHVLLVDVSELGQVRNVAAELASKEPSIHAIVCNAGVLLNEKQETSEGKEVTYASHLLGGSYLLPQLLLPQLKADSDPRVIMVTSGGMYNFKLPKWELVTSEPTVKYNGVNVYAYAKRGQVLLAERLAQQEPEITWVTVHPGWADTNAVDEAFGSAKKYLNPLRDPWEGAEGVCWLLTAPRDKLENGALYLDRKTQPKHIAGLFYSEGSYTKNTPEEVDDMMENLKKDAGL